MSVMWANAEETVIQLEGNPCDRRGKSPASLKGLLELMSWRQQDFLWWPTPLFSFALRARKMKYSEAMGFATQGLRLGGLER